jgi:hypothetical protein
MTQDQGAAWSIDMEQRGDWFNGITVGADEDARTWSDADARETFWNAICSLRIHFCPTRRGGGQQTMGLFSDTENLMLTGRYGRNDGPATDYAFIVVFLKDATTTDYTLYTDSHQDAHRNENSGVCPTLGAVTK